MHRTRKHNFGRDGRLRTIAYQRMLAGKLQKLAVLGVLPRTWKPLLSTGTAAAVEHRHMLAHTKPSTVIDVGANNGQFSIMARQVMPSANIIAFEPLQTAADCYEENFRADPYATLYRCALGDENRVATLHRASRLDSSSLRKLGDGQRQAYGITSTDDTAVEMRRIDDIISADDLIPPTLLKIDVQGTEDSVLKGAGTLLGAVDFICAEVSFAELYQGQPTATDIVCLLNQYGFELRGTYNQSLSTAFGPTQCDFLFCRRNSFLSAW